MFKWSAMDHHGQSEQEGNMKSQAHEGAVNICDNMLGYSALTVQTQNLNEANTLVQTEGFTPSDTGKGGCGLMQKASPNNNGSREQVEQREVGSDDGSRDYEEDEDTDEVMKEEEEESESSCPSHCLSPGTPMTDSSYSETGSLLESSCPFSPGTSPEPSSPVLKRASSVEVSQSDADIDITMSDTAPITDFITCTDGPAPTEGPIGLKSRTPNPAASMCITQSTDMADKMTSYMQQPTVECGPTETQVFTSSCAGDDASKAETLGSNTGCTSTVTSSSTTSGPLPSSSEHFIPIPVTTSASVSTCSTAPTASSALLESLEQLAQRGDDSHLPHYLHQVAEALVIQKDYQRALWCIQLQRLYHQRVLDNLNALQEQWESQCRGTSPDLTSQQLDSLKHICQTHTRPRTRDAECRTPDPSLRPQFQAANQVEKEMEDFSKPLMPSNYSPERISSPEISERDMKDPGSVYGCVRAEKDTNNGEREKAEGGVGHTIAVIGNGLHPSTAGGMDQSISAEQQGQDLESAPKKEADNEEERNVEVAVEAVEMEDGEEEEESEEEEEEEEEMERCSSLCSEALPVETLVSGTAVEFQSLHQEELCSERTEEETQLCHETQQDGTDLCCELEDPLLQEVRRKHHDQQAEEPLLEEDYEDYDVDIMREAPLLDDMAKLISVEEVSPPSGLVSILKKRNVCEDTVCTTSTLKIKPQKPVVKRRVRFKVPDDGYDPDLGSGDSCLLLFLLCLVTVVISIGGTALYCALGDAQSSVCQDFSRNADFYFGQLQHVMSQIQHWFALGL